MIVVSHFLGVEQSDIVKAYEVIIQFSAILAVLFLYKDRLNVKSIPTLEKCNYSLNSNISNPGKSI